MKAILGGLATVLLLAMPALAQAPAPGPAAQERGVAVPSPGRDAPVQPAGLIDVMLENREELGLSSAQVESLEQLLIGALRESIRRGADLNLARLDLAVLLRPDTVDPGKPVDTVKAEAKIREMAQINADLQVAYLHTIEAGKAQLTADQRAKLAALVADDSQDDPPAPPRGLPHGLPGGSRGHPGAPDRHPGARHSRPSIGIWPSVRWDPYWFYAPPPMIVQEPPVYVQQPAAPQAYWYYCASAGAYYPGVPSCPEPWIPVPASGG